MIIDFIVIRLCSIAINYEVFVFVTNLVPRYNYIHVMIFDVMQEECNCFCLSKKSKIYDRAYSDI